jgi:outer membrane autotransporter protein
MGLPQALARGVESDGGHWYLARSGLSATADAILNTAAMLGRDWHYSLDALHLRLGDVRDTLAPPPSRPSAPSAPSPSSTPSHSSHRTSTSAAPAAPASTAAGGIWARARAYRLNADATLTGRAFDEYAYGLTTGADRAFRLGDHSATALLGAFLDLGRIDRDFAGPGATGHTNNLSAGLYATWLHDAGWHADLVLKADRYKHRFDTLTADARPIHGAYSSNAQGLSLELGRRLQRHPATAANPAAAGWWVEPAAQAALAWLHGASYRTAPGNQTLDVRLDTARAAQYRAQVRFGRALANSRWTPYGKFGVVKTDTTGGAIHAAGERFAPDYDGWREEFGLGASYRVSETSQLYFDYEYARAPAYERPWSLHLGYRQLW